MIDLQRFNRVINHRNQIHTNLLNRQPNLEASPILIKRQKSKEKAETRLDTISSAKNSLYPYSVLFKL